MLPGGWESIVDFADKKRLSATEKLVTLPAPPDAEPHQKRNRQKTAWTND